MMRPPPPVCGAVMVMPELPPRSKLFVAVPVPMMDLKAAQVAFSVVIVNVL